MSHLWIAVLMLAVPGDDPPAGSSDSSEAGSPTETARADAPRSEAIGQTTVRDAAALREAVRHTMRATAAASRGEVVDEASVRAMVALYEEIERDRQLSNSQRARFRTRLRSRLMRIEEVLSRRLARAEAEARRRARRAAAEAPQAPGAVEVPREAAAVHPQFGPRAGAAPGGFAGGPAGAGFGRGAGGDLGWQLVDLIRNTIEPDSWDVNGGPGTIYYYRRQRVLVIRNRQDVHEQIGGTLRALRQQ